MEHFNGILFHKDKQHTNQSINIMSEKYKDFHEEYNGRNHNDKGGKRNIKLLRESSNRSGES